MRAFLFCKYYFLRSFVASSSVQWVNETLELTVSFLKCEMYFLGPYPVTYLILNISMKIFKLNT